MQHNRTLVVLLAVAIGSCSPQHKREDATLEPSAPLPPSGTSKIPKRAQNAITGSAFVHLISNVPPATRERMIQHEILTGNIPNFLRRLQPIHLTHTSGGMYYNAIAWVMPDYLAIGSDKDFVRMPMTPATAQMIADRFGYVLPTPRLVRQISLQSAAHLEPIPLKPGPEMTGVRYLALHNDLIQKQIATTSPKLRPSALISGQKKDIVATNALSSHPGHVAIFGWQDPRGHLHQPLCTTHGANYADYSHGARLVLGVMVLNGKTKRTVDILKDPRANPLVSHEGALLTANATGKR